MCAPPMKGGDPQCDSLLDGQQQGGCCCWCRQAATGHVIAQAMDAGEGPVLGHLSQDQPILPRQVQALAGGSELL